MGYIDSHMITGEELIYRGHLHKIIFIKPAIVLIAGLGIMFLPIPGGESVSKFLMYLGLGVVGFGMLWAFWVWLDFVTSEFGITNKRVLIKSGLIRRRTVEMFLNKVENIGVDQSVAGRIINSGSLTITGSGGSREHFKNISDPLDFRRQVHEQIAQVNAEDGDTGKHD